MARTAAKVEKEINRLDEIRDRNAKEEADAAEEQAAATREMAAAMLQDDPLARLPQFGTILGLRRGVSLRK